MSSRPRSRLRALGVAAAVLVAGLALLEAVARDRFGVPLPERLPVLQVRANVRRGWEMVPGDHYCYQNRVHVNALGLRGPEIAPREPGEVRVLALGDSLVFGQGVADDETLPICLEQALRAADPEERRWRVFNGGLRGYDTLQELRLLNELGPRLDLDVAVMFWFWNDFQMNDIDGSYRRLSAKGPVAYDTGTRLEGLEWLRWQAKQLLRRSALIMAIHDRRRAAEATPFERPHFEKGLVRLREQLGWLVASARTLGCQPVVVVIPDANRLRGPFFTDWVDGQALALARELGIDAVGLEEPLRALYERRGGSAPVIPYDGHYLPEANQAMARFLAPRFLSLGIPH